MTAPRTTHLVAILRILHYIKGIVFHGFHFLRHSSIDLPTYSDVDWAGDPIDQCSNTGDCFFLGDSLIS